MTNDGTARLVEAASARYRSVFSRRFAKEKLARDPLFATLLRTAAIPDASCLVDLGCGQGLLAAWLHVARETWSTGDGSAWPADWQAAPKVATYLGIDRSRLDIGRARKALPAFARVFRGDLRQLGNGMLERCDVVTLFDVLQYLDPASQDALFVAIADSLPPWGVIVMRVGDGAATAASRWSNGVDLVIGWLRGHPRWRLYRRTIAEWNTRLESHGFVVEILDDPRVTGAGDGFANVLLRATRTRSASSGIEHPVR